MEGQKISVLVVDDHPIVRRGLCAEIDQDPELHVVGMAADGNQAVEMAAQLNPNVILMDLVLPGKDGIEAIEEIMNQNPQARILVLTSFYDDEQVYAALEAGAMGYVLKDRQPDEVLSAIKKIASGEPYFNSMVVKGLLRQMRSKTRKEPAPEMLLTGRELDVLRWVAKGTPNKEIALMIGVSQATVRAHVSNILSKLGLENRSQMVLYAVRKGLVKD